MDYMVLTLGVLGMFGFFFVYLKSTHRSIWYEIGLLGSILSWVVWVLGIWMVAR